MVPPKGSTTMAWQWVCSFKGTSKIWFELTTWNYFFCPDRTRFSQPTCLVVCVHNTLSHWFAIRLLRQQAAKAKAAADERTAEEARKKEARKLRKKTAPSTVHPVTPAHHVNEVAQAVAEPEMVTSTSALEVPEKKVCLVSKQHMTAFCTFWYSFTNTHMQRGSVYSWIYFQAHVVDT